MADSGNSRSSDETGGQDATADDTDENEVSQPPLIQHGFQNYYELLDISPEADPDEIKSAYRAKTKEYHPDVSDKENATELFSLLQDAKEVLTDLKERSRYDQLGHWLYLDRRTPQDITIPDDVTPEPIIEREDPVVDLEDNDDETDDDDDGDDDDEDEASGPKAPGEARARRSNRTTSTNRKRSRTKSSSTSASNTSRSRNQTSSTTGGQTATRRAQSEQTQSSSTSSQGQVGDQTDNVYKWAREATEALSENDRGYVEELWRGAWMKRAKAFVAGLLLLAGVGYAVETAGFDGGVTEAVPTTDTLLSAEIFLPVLCVQALALVLFTGLRADARLGGGSTNEPGPKPTRILRDGLLLLTLGNAVAIFTGITGESSWFLAHDFVFGSGPADATVPVLSEILPPVGVVATAGILPVLASVLGCFMVAVGVSHRAWYDGYLTESSTTPYIWELPVIAAFVVCVFGAVFGTADMGYGLVELPAQITPIVGGGTGVVPMAAGGFLAAVVAEVWAFIYLVVRAV